MKYAPLILLAACGPSVDHPTLDAAPSQGSDARPSADAGPDGPPGAYQHGIVVDGTNDFASGEIFATTSSPSFSAHISWDSENLYLGYSGPDLDPAAPSASTKWLFAYVDVDLAAATGATASQTYNTQSATLPTGFGADYYLRRKCDGTLTSLEVWNGTGWTSSPTAPTTAQGTAFAELSIPRSALGSPATLGITTWMINEGNLVESTYAGLYAGSFVDGYDANVTKYLAVDFASASVPNDPTNAAP